MNIRDEELLHRYFERQMSTGEEQNFLIDVAARDDMRVAFRSQLEMLKAVRRDKDVMRGATFVRERTLSALGFASAALPTFLAEEEAEAAPQIATATSSGWRALLHKPMVMLTGGLLVGSIATIGVVTMQNSDVAPQRQVVSTPSVQQAPQEILITEPAVQAPVQNIVSEPEVVAGKTKSVARKSAAETNAPATSMQENQNLPLMDRVEPASVTVKPAKILRPDKTK